MESAVLFVSPYGQDVDSLARILYGASILLDHAVNVKEATARLKTGRYRVVLTEANLDDGNWRDILNLTGASGSQVVVTDAWADARFWAETINLGAFDMLVQPFHPTEVRRVLSSAFSSQTSGKMGARVDAAAS